MQYINTAGGAMGGGISISGIASSMGGGHALGRGGGMGGRLVGSGMGAGIAGREGMGGCHALGGLAGGGMGAGIAGMGTDTKVA
jgi:hypothetical protein